MGFAIICNFKNHPLALYYKIDVNGNCIIFLEYITLGFSGRGMFEEHLLTDVFGKFDFLMEMKILNAFKIL
jgi:hypothetical protein